MIWFYYPEGVSRKKEGEEKDGEEEEEEEKDGEEDEEKILVSKRSTLNLSKANQKKKNKIQNRKKQI